MSARFWQRAIDQFGAIVIITVAERIICDGYLDIWVYLDNLTWIGGIGLVVSLIMYAHTVVMEKSNDIVARGRERLRQKADLERRSYEN